MRTTISIHDELLKSAKIRAKEQGKTLGELVEDGLRRELSVSYNPADRPPVPIFRGGNGLMPGVDLTSNRALYELLDEGLPLDKRR
jgi:uncharacterized protein YggE